ncbi:O-antigen ligase family protein [Sulfuricystis multivorans]|uniref:O-antigen ligase family protein n=1 Tax=Sulfuricystis multivorans TaxID=2211108 RepID=UPI000F840258|nr:O-antigen ligase family protein [Sulfuricystis multivorans]
MKLSLQPQWLDGMLGKGAGGLVIALCLLAPNVERQPATGLAALLAILVLLRLLITGRKILNELDSIDWAMAGLLVSAALSTFFGWPSPSGRMQGVAEAAALFTLFYGIRHGGYDQVWLRRFAQAAVIGAMIAAMLGLVAHLVDHRPFTLPGIPGTIRAAVYLGISLLLAIGFAQEQTGYARFVWATAALFLFMMVLFLHSRAVVIGIIFCLWIGFSIRFRTRALGLMMAIFLMILIMPTMMPKEIRATFEAKATELAELILEGKISANDRLRVAGWQIAVAWIKHGDNALLGIGPRNYHMLSTKRGSLALPGQVDEQAWNLSHAHNMFLTRYVEQGILGLIVLLFFLLSLAKRMARDAFAGKIDWKWWGAFGGLVLPVLNGLVGSPWNHEYVWLAVLLFAIYLALRDRARVQPS